MFETTTVHNPEYLFEGVVILERKESISVKYSYPTCFSLKSYYDLIFPCSCKKERSEEYTIVASNANNDRSFIMCQYLSHKDLYICLLSLNPWFEIHSKLLTIVSKSCFILNGLKSLDLYLEALQPLNLKDNFIVLQDPDNNNHQKFLKPSLSYPSIYDKYIKEYLTSIRQDSEYNKQLWLEIYWNMLLERPIIFMSSRYQKLTSTMLAATFFIHPLSWAHKFVSIVPQKNPQLLGTNCCLLGIHSCMASMLPTVDFWNEALLVDLDKGTTQMVGESDNAKETKSRFKIPNRIKSFYITQLARVDKSVTSLILPSSSITHSNNTVAIQDDRDILSSLENIVSVIRHRHNTESQLFCQYQRGFHLYPLVFRTITVVLMGLYRNFFSILPQGKVSFDKDSYIQHIPKLSTFLELFVQSQSFANFVSDKLEKFAMNETDFDRFDKERLELKIESIHEKYFKNSKRRGQYCKHLSTEPFSGYTSSIYSSASSLANYSGGANDNGAGRTHKTSTMPNFQKRSSQKQSSSRTPSKNRAQSTKEPSNQYNSSIKVAYGANTQKPPRPNAPPSNLLSTKVTAANNALKFDRDNEESFTESIMKSLEANNILMSNQSGDDFEDDSDSDNSTSLACPVESNHNNKKQMRFVGMRQISTANHQCIRESKSEDNILNQEDKSHSNIPNAIKKEEIVPGLVKSYINKYNQLASHTTKPLSPGSHPRSATVGACESRGCNSEKSANQIDKPPRIRKISLHSTNNYHRCGICGYPSPLKFNWNYSGQK